MSNAAFGEHGRTGARSPGLPPGWPRAVPPPGAPGWQRRAVGWLLDLCPADYRGHAVLARQPHVLAYLAAEHVRSSLEGVARARAGLRAELSALVPPQVVEAALEVLDAEEARLRAAQHAVVLVTNALRGIAYVPRL
ncbi:MAG: hypothetical protein ACLGIA_10920 [Actinomycetes bacterium]